jgi:hypothetical protein
VLVLHSIGGSRQCGKSLTQTKLVMPSTDKANVL